MPGFGLPVLGADVDQAIDQEQAKQQADRQDDLVANGQVGQPRILPRSPASRWNWPCEIPLMWQ